MYGNADTYVFFVASSRFLVVRGFMMQKIDELDEKRRENNEEDEEKEGILK